MYDMQLKYLPHTHRQITAHRYYIIATISKLYVCTYFIHLTTHPDIDIDISSQNHKLPSFQVSIDIYRPYLPKLVLEYIHPKFLSIKYVHPPPPPPPHTKCVDRCIHQVPTVCTVPHVPAYRQRQLSSRGGVPSTHVNRNPTKTLELLKTQIPNLDIDLEVSYNVTLELSNSPSSAMASRPLPVLTATRNSQCAQLPATNQPQLQHLQPIIHINVVNVHDRSHMHTRCLSTYLLQTCRPVASCNREPLKQEVTLALHTTYIRYLGNILGIYQTVQSKFQAGGYYRPSTTVSKHLKYVSTIPSMSKIILNYNKAKKKEKEKRKKKKGHENPGTKREK